MSTDGFTMKNPTETKRRLLAFLPDVNHAVSLGCLTIDDANRVWRRIEPEFKGMAVAVFLHGSVLRGDAKPYSDIDLVIVKSTGAQIEKLSVVVDGYLVDASVLPMPLIRIDGKIAGEASFCLRSIVNGQCIWGNDTVAHQAQSALRAFYARKEVSANQLAVLERRMLSNLTAIYFRGADQDIAGLVMDNNTLILSILALRKFNFKIAPRVYYKYAELSEREILNDLFNKNIDAENYVKFVLDNIGFRHITSNEL